MSKEELEEYVSRGLSTRKIAEIVGVTQSLVSRLCKEFGIKTICKPGPKSSIERTNCKCCSAEVKRLGNNYCSGECYQLHRYNSVIEQWKDGKLTPNQHFKVSAFIRRYLFTKYDSKCCLCGWCCVSKYTKKIPLEVDHVDGDWKDFSEENLQLLCPNCHSLTPFHKALNKGRGRPHQRVKYE